MKRLTYGIAALLLLVAVLAGCGASKEANTDKTPPENLEPLDTALLADSAVFGMKVLSENDRYQLCLNPETTDFALVDKASGRTIYSRPGLTDDGVALSEETMGKLYSSLIVEYNNKGQTEGVFNSIDDSVAYGQFELFSIPQGVRIVYTLGVDAEKELLPRVLTVECYEEIMAKLDSRQGKTISSNYMLLKSSEMTDGQPSSYIDKEAYLKQYPALKTRDLYVLRDINENKKERVKEVFAEIGFTYEQMVEQRNLAGAVFEEKSLNIVVPLDLTLDEGGLRAAIDAELVTVTEGYAVTRISLLPGFNATAAEGDFIVPDGAGAIIPMQSSFDFTYSQQIYGGDVSKITAVGYANATQAVLPFFAMMTNEYTLLAAISEGEAMATVFAQPKDTSRPAAQAYAKFTVTDTDYRKVADPGLSLQNYMELMTAKGREHGKFAVYYMVSDSTSYAKVAVDYREYLEKTGVLTGSSSEKHPFLLDLYGLLKKDSNVMGIPVSIKQTLTTFEQAKTILTELNDGGVDDIRVRYLGVANGGLQNRLFKDMKIESALGGLKGFKELRQWAADRGVRIYPDAALHLVYDDKPFDSFSASGDVSRQIGGKNVTLTKTSLVDGQPGKELFRYMVTPSKLFECAQNLSEKLKKRGIDTLSLSTVGNMLYSDFNRKKFTTRADAQRLTVQALSELKDAGISLMADTGHQYVLPYADVLLNIPAGNSALNVETKSIPFLQIVLSGHADYAMAPFNRSSDTQWERLKAIETGSCVYYGFMYEDNLVLKNTEFEDLNSINYATWIDEALASYAYVAAALEPVMGSRISDHWEISDRVAVTAYENGYKVYVNYGDADYTVDGVTVPANGYYVGGGGIE